MEDNISKITKTMIVTIILCLLLNMYAFTFNGSPLHTKAISTLAIISSLYAIYYLSNNYAKSAAAGFKYYMLICVAYFGLIAIDGVPESEGIRIALANGITFIINVILIAGFLALALGKDLGKTKSMYIVGGVTLLAALSVLMVMIKMFPDAAVNTDEKVLMMVRNMTKMILCINASVMVNQKYADKENRGTL